MSGAYSRNCPKRKVRDVTSNTEILSITNPEIFDISPRPGGFLKIMVPTKSQDYIAVDGALTCDVLSSTVGVSFKDRTTASSRSTRSKKSFISLLSTTSKAPRHISMIVPETPSREFRLSRAIMETDWDITAVDETNTVVGISNPFQDSINMLAITITTVMLLAAKLDIAEEYLTWTEEYLTCFKDDNGMYPPNIDGILTEIAKKRCECPKKCVDEIEECEVEKEVIKKDVKKKSSTTSKASSLKSTSKSSPTSPASQRSTSPKSSKSKSPPKSPPRSPSSKKGSSSPNKSSSEQESDSKRKKSSKSEKSQQ